MTAFLFITGLIFSAVGLYGLINPLAAVAPVGLQLESVSSINQMRASAGAIPLLAGLFMCASVFRLHWQTAALWLVSIILGGLIFGRLISMLVDGMPGTANLWFLGLESFGFVQAVFWLRVMEGSS